jgi:two-component system response regulator HydG
MRARLTIETGDGNPRAVDLDPAAVTTVGRSRKNSLVLKDEHASREHAKVYCEKEEWYLEEVKSLNDTYVNGVKIAGRRRLDGGDIIGIATIRLRFQLDDTDRPAPVAIEASSVVSAGTVFLTDELTALYEFMTGSVRAVEAQLLLERTLETVVRQTGAQLAGFLSLDADNPISKMIWPPTAQMNRDLSRRLTQRVGETGRTAWLQRGDSQDNSSGSLVAFNDAVCVPVTAHDQPLGALHVYHERRPFTEREVQFCEVVASFTASCLGRLRLMRMLVAENDRLKGHSSLGDKLIGDSAAMRDLRHRIARAGASSAVVLVEGESGVGKELVASALHRTSPRASGPFVVAHCGALTDNLIESQLFGHRKGAFTGAVDDHAGYFQQADDGTLFLDEIGDMPLEGQVRLLRVIEGMPFRPVGGTADIRADVRIVAATNKDLEKAVAAKEFRADLFFRLRVIYLRVPPLREHAEDIPAIVQHFLKRFSVPGVTRKEISEPAMRRLQEYHWPGNVRQLRSVLESAVIMGEGSSIEPKDLGFLNPSAADDAVTLNLEQVEALTIKKAMARSSGNITQAAQILGIGRDTLRKKLQQQEPEKPDEK